MLPKQVVAHSASEKMLEALRGCYSLACLHVALVLLSRLRVPGVIALEYGRDISPECLVNVRVPCLLDLDGPPVDRLFHQLVTEGQGVVEHVGEGPYYVRLCARGLELDVVPHPPKCAGNLRPLGLCGVGLHRDPKHRELGRLEVALQLRLLGSLGPRPFFFIDLTDRGYTVSLRLLG